MEIFTVQVKHKAQHWLISRLHMVQMHRNIDILFVNGLESSNDYSIYYKINETLHIINV